MFSSIDRSSMGSEVMQAGHQVYNHYPKILHTNIKIALWQAVSMGGIFVFDTSIAEDTGSLSAMPQTITLPRLGKLQE